jgi:hypothetical protein
MLKESILINGVCVEIRFFLKFDKLAKFSWANRLPEMKNNNKKYALRSFNWNRKYLPKLVIN